MAEARHTQRGVALAMLLWMLAGLSLLVAGVMTLSRTDVQLTRLQLEQARGQAAAEGAGHLLMRDLILAQQTGKYNGRGHFRRSYQLGEEQLRARAIPLAGLIAINQAPEALLRDMYHYLGEMPRDEAEELATATAQWRAKMGGDSGGGGGGSFGSFASFSQQGGGVPAFGVKEDLLQVPGMRRAVYDRIVPAIHARAGGQAGVDPASAPQSVLRVLSKGDEGAVDFIRKARQDSAPGDMAGSDRLNPAHLLQSDSSGSGYCLIIDIKGPGDRVMQQRIWVEIQTDTSGLPWRIARMEPLTANRGDNGSF